MGRGSNGAREHLPVRHATPPAPIDERWRRAAEHMGRRPEDIDPPERFLLVLQNDPAASSDLLFETYADIPGALERVLGLRRSPLRFLGLTDLDRDNGLTLHSRAALTGPEVQLEVPVEVLQRRADRFLLDEKGHNGPPSGRYLALVHQPDFGSGLAGYHGTAAKLTQPDWAPFDHSLFGTGELYGVVDLAQDPPRTVALTLTVFCSYEGDLHEVSALDRLVEGAAPSVADADRLAAQAHAVKVDRTGRPYVEHPRRMAARATTDDLRMVALLHDVLEDGPVPRALLEAMAFPEEVLRAVDALTRRPDETYAQHIARVKAYPLALEGKLLDLADHLDPALAGGLVGTSLEQRYRSAWRELTGTDFPQR